AKPPKAPSRARISFSWRPLLLLAVPASWAMVYFHAHPGLVFAVACLGVMPLAGYMGEATEHLATRTGPAFGGLLNATFGNAAELIIAIVALRAGMVELVKASIIGSILGNLLLIGGLSVMAAGLGRSVVSFNRTGVGAAAGMLALAVVGLVFPALFHSLHPEAGVAMELGLSEIVAIVLAVTYLLSLVFSLVTHRSLFSGDPHPTTTTVWRSPVAITVLLLATLGVVAQSEILVETARAVVETTGISEVFLGLILIPVIGNAAEHAAAIMVARKGNIDLAFQISLGSSTQIALLVAPVLVLVGVMVGQPMNLVFTPFEVAAVGLATIVTAIITLDGETHWFEGVQLLATFTLFAATAWVM
ncbi:MAG: calcium/proton exchanger, partial [Gemmatimonadota bacterium]